jgi:hypothetical protein
MAFNYLKNKREEHIKEFESHVRDEFLEKIKWYKENNMVFSKESLPERMNSYENNLFMPLWSNDYLIERTKYYLSNAWREFNRTDEYEIDDSYNEVLKHKLIHMLLERLEEKCKE